MQNLETLDSTSIPSREGDWSKHGYPWMTLSTGVSLNPLPPIDSFTGSFQPDLIKQKDHSQAFHEIQNQDVVSRLLESHEIEAPSRVVIAREHRLELLAKKYEGVGITREDEARIAILTQRLRRLTPRVSRVAWTIAEESVTQLEGVSARIDEISEKYGL